MEVFSGDTEESVEDISGRKKSKLKSLKTRLFGRNKRTGGEEDTQLSQSASDITAGERLGSDEDLACSQGTMGSRALSHDSIFLADLVLTDAEPARVLSQENVHSKIKALQIKLQQQKMHLGPPPKVLSIRCPEDVGTHSEDSLPHSPPDILRGDITSQRAIIKTISQPASRPLSPTPKSAPTKSLPPTPSHPFPLSIPSNSSSCAVEPPLDFNTPIQFTACLDTSAARHRMSVKPRNQRASTKKKLTVTQSTSQSHTLNNIDHFESMKEEPQLGAQEEETVKTEQEEVDIPITSQCLSSKSAEVEPATSETAPKSSSISQQDHPPPWTVPFVASQVLQLRPHRRVDAMPGERPHSSFIESEFIEKNEGDFEIQEMSHDKRNTFKKAGLTDVFSDHPPASISSMIALRSSSVQQQVQVEGESTRGIRRPAPGSGSFHFSIKTAKNRDGERPRSGSFVEELEQTEDRQKTTRETEERNIRDMEELKGLQPKGGSFVVGRFRQEDATPKSSVIPWHKRESLKKVESVTPSKYVPTDTGTVEGEEMRSSQEMVEEAEEAKEVVEEEGKTAFGVKLRSTSQSVRLRSENSSNHHSKTVLAEEYDTQKRQDTSKTAGSMSEKLPVNISCRASTSRAPTATDPAPSGSSLPVRHNAPFTDNPHVMPTEVQMTSSNLKEAETTEKPQEPQPAPQTTSSEVSWMSLAMEKTRSLQQLFTSRFPRDFTAMQTTGQPQAQVQSTNQTETVTGAQIQTQAVKIQPKGTQLQAANQPSSDTVKVETVQSRSQTQTVILSPVAVPQKMSVATSIQSNTSREPQMLKQMSEDQPQPNTTPSASHSVSTTAVKTNPWTAQSSLHSSSQIETTSQVAQGSTTQSLAQSYLSSGQQQPSWINRGLHPVNQFKSTSSTVASVSSVSSAAVPPSVSAWGKGEKEATMQKDSPSLSTRRAFCAGSVSERASFLEKRQEGTTPPGPSGVELKKAQTEVQIPGEPPALIKNAPLNKDTAPEGRQWVKLAASSLTKVPERPREDKWPRKNMAPSSSPSSSPTLPSVLQSMSDSGQPSWMELAKRKSMAWSDKTMD